MRSAIAAVVLLGLGACTASHQRTTTLRVWHFWSEPAQERAFTALIEAFERTHPDIRVETTPLQWSDGKAKLQIAFSSGTPPDVVHIGAEWVAEFAPVLADIPDSLTANLCREFLPIGMAGQRRVAVPWTVNARVCFVHHQLKLPPEPRWSELVTRLRSFHAPPQRYGIGLCSSDPHNVLKRVLPWLWALGAPLLTVYPFSATCTGQTAAALDTLTVLVACAVVEPSRSLDARMRRGELGVVLSGVWMLADSLVLRQYQVLPALPSRPGVRGESILSGDCFAVARSSMHREKAIEFLAYLARWESAATFCHRVPDAGFPAQQPPTSAALDSLLRRAPQWRHAYAQTLQSRLLPSPPVFLDAEYAVEEAITALLYGRSDGAQTTRMLAQRLRAIEGAHQ